jgi:hypothetical protein
MTETSPAQSSVFDLRVRSTSSGIHLRLGRGTTAIGLTVVTMLALGTFGFLRSLTLEDARLTVTAADPFAPVESPLESQTPTPSSSLAIRTSAAARQSGLNYLVFGTTSSPAEALRLREQLARSGVETSIEPALPGWSSRGYSVVGLRGFDLPRENVLYGSYLQALQAKKLKPAAYRWRAETEVARR